MFFLRNFFYDCGNEANQIICIDVEMKMIFYCIAVREDR